MTLLGLVRQAYPSPEWAVFHEVAAGSRYADAVALGIWPSRGQALIGFEFKEDRRDWLREKKNPAKAEAVSMHVDGFYLVAGREDVAKIGELPDPWGLYVANADRSKLKLLKPCTMFPDRDKTVVKRVFVAAMLRRVSENTIPKSEVQALVAARVKDALADTREGREIEMLRDRIERLQRALDAFKQATGVDLLHGYQGPTRIVEAVKAILRAGDERRRLERAHQALVETTAAMEKALKAWPEASS